jgi:ABC-2 type transport system permease protein
MTAALALRSLRTTWRVPALTLTPLMTSVFFLVIYVGQLGDAGTGMLRGTSYVDFIVPLVLLTTACIGGAVAGQLIVRDVQSGYHRRLLLTSAGAGRATGAAVMAGAVVLATQNTVVVLAGMFLGLRGTGAAAMVGLVLATTMVGAGFSLLGVAAALRFGTDAAVNAATMIFFPLAFLTGVFAPRDELTGWMSVAARINPLSYLLEGLRAVTSADLSSTGPGLLSLAALLVTGCATCAAALHAARNAR